MLINDEYFKQKFNKQIHNSKIKKLNDEELNYLKFRYKDSLSIKETIFRIINDIDIHPKCSECENLAAVKYRKEKPFYSTCLSQECILKRKSNGPKESCNKKYGVNNVFQLETVKEKIKLNHLNKYGCCSHTQNNDWKIKQQNNLHKKYGVINQFQREEVKNKIKKTCLEKYGVEHYNQSDDFKYKMSLIASSDEFQNKRNNTLNKNNTWKTSKDEEYIYNILSSVFNNIKRQYKSELYPFNCDFYIPEIDTYIEYQGSDLHNGRPYLNTINDKNELLSIFEKSQKLKNKNHKNKTRYDSLIETWVIRDVNKRNIAKQNNINYIEFWSINEFNSWIENITIK